jgi:hypothetical protein
VACRLCRKKSYLNPATVLQKPQLLALIPLYPGAATKDKVKPLALPQLDKRLRGRYRVVEIDLSCGFGVRVSECWASQCPDFGLAIVVEAVRGPRDSTRHKLAPHRAGEGLNRCMK